MTRSKDEEALEAAASLLEDIDAGRLDALGAVRRAVVLARLADDSAAADWLFWELRGYPGDADGRYIAGKARNSAYLSGRVVQAHEANPTWPLFREAETTRVNPASLSRLALMVETIAPLMTPDARIGGEVLREYTAARRIPVDVLTAVHLWTGGVHHRLRFGTAVETAFGVVRREVDASISELIPDGLVKLAAALENAVSDNPEHWANAASTCRRLLKAAADALRPPGPDKGGRKMGDPQYINRVRDWIEEHATSGTMAGVVIADLEHLGARLEASASGGHKGAHAEVSRFDASRFITGTYLLLGDILRLRRADAPD